MHANAFVGDEVLREGRYMPDFLWLLNFHEQTWVLDSSVRRFVWIRSLEQITNYNPTPAVRNSETCQIIIRPQRKHHRIETLSVEIVTKATIIHQIRHSDLC